MGRINRLPDDLANQIAAGEVVERPASVVKELVENAIDAGARRIAIHIELGGKKQVRVEDDGDGMEPEDARLAIERHATSKIARSEDLAAILTLGFRGEALPSIASVSHFRLRTRARGRDSGTEIRVNGGTIASNVEVGAPEGTLVEVNDLFYNLPARRKFLKADGPEAAQVSRVVTQLALGYHEVGFTLTSGPRTVLQFPPAASRLDRLYQIYGDRSELVEIRRQTAGVTLVGYVAPLTENGPARGAQNVYVNRRVVKDRTIAHAIIDAYSMASIKERSPEVHLFIDMPPDMVDVNVHPTKAEVRFREQSFMHEIVRRSIMDGLGTGPAPQLQLRPESAHLSPVARAIPGILGGGAFPNRWLPSAAGTGGGGSWVPTAFTALAGAGPEAGASPDQPGGARPLGSLAGQTDGALTPGGATVEIRLTARQSELERLGYEVDAFGPSTLSVRAVPALLSAGDSAEALTALADDLEGLDRGGKVQDALQRIAATTACHAAVKANYPLTYEKMVHILDELRATAYSSICPHGRPVMLRLTRREIEKNFDRI